MEFRTTVKPLNYQGTISHRHPLIMLGSCFSDNIGTRLQQAMFNVDINPFGTLYNPASIAYAIDYILTKRTFTSSDLFKKEDDKLYHSFYHHSDFSRANPTEMLSYINNRISAAAENMLNAEALIITFGTSYVYRFCDTGAVVANCHKMPATQFERQLMDVDGIVAMWLPLLERLTAVNPTMKIIFTVSPIRHLADGFHENQLSKSILHLAIDKIINKRDEFIYFPAYEIMNDDLRDYRFYAADMIHPSNVAIDYIYSLFAQSFFDSDTLELARQGERLNKRLAHRHRTDDEDTIKTFSAETQQIIDTLVKAHPYLEAAIKRLIVS